MADTLAALAAIRAARTQLDTAEKALTDTGWKVGDVAVAVADPLQLYDAAHNPSGAPRPHYTSTINILAVSADGQWLTVFASPHYEVRAADVKHK